MHGKNRSDRRQDFADGVLDIEKVDVGDISPEDITNWDFLICGIPTWDVGQRILPARHLRRNG